MEELEFQKDDLQVTEKKNKVKEVQFEEPKKDNIELKSLSKDETSISVNKEEIVENEQNSQVLSDLQKLFPTGTGRMIPLRQKIFIFLEEPTGGKWSQLFSLFITIIIIISTIMFIMGSVPSYYNRTPRFFYLVEYTCLVIYTMEYMARLVCSPKWYKWMLEPFSILDAVVIIPFYVELVTASQIHVEIIRTIRLLKVFQIFKIGKYSSTFLIVMKTLRNSRDGFVLLFCLMTVGMVFFSSAMFYAEQVGQHFDPVTQTWYRNDGTVSPYQSIPSTFWWCLVTITTVGYGDTYPVTWPGKCVAVCTMICGIFVLAFPITLFGLHFNDIWKEEEMKGKLREKMEEHKQRRLRESGEISPNFSQDNLVSLLEKIEKHHILVAHDLENIASTFEETKTKHELLSETILALNLEIKLLKSKLSID